MKSPALLSLCLLLFCLNTKAQNLPDNIVKQSVLTHQYLSSVNQNAPAKANPKFVYTELGNQKYLNAFVKVNDQLVAEDLDSLGILVGTKAGNIWTVKIPTNQVEAFTALERGIELVELDQPIFINMEEAREKTNVDMVHEGTDLPQAYTGKDVVVGILDVGFDYTHPTFYDVDGVEHRIKKVWEQKSTGTPPAGYSYGHEMDNSTDMITQQTDSGAESHGTHVAGIAAGSGFGGDEDEYRGVAYESDLVLVGITPAQNQWHNTGMTDIVDGLNYIFEYADAQGKPAVANLSWGCSIGPHDGSSLFSQAVNNLTGAGKIFTVSGGNNGGQNLHLNKAFSDTDSILQSFIEFNANLPDQKTWIDVWGVEGEPFCIELGTYNDLNNNASTDFICLQNTTTTEQIYLVGSDNDTVYVDITTTSADINGKPHAFLDIYSKTNDDLAISVKATTGEVHAWMGYVQNTRGIYGEFVSNGLAGAVDGDDDMTIGEMGCTESAITVGAYASKVSFTNLSGQNLSYNNYVQPNRICPFSSKGPTTDGRTKPDITAPGMTMASAMNSFDTNYAPGGASYNLVVHQYTDPNTSQNYYFGESSGTSMSAPMTAGIVALFLEANPLATPEELKTLMGGTAITDNYTTDTPDPNIWGFGKINAHAMLQMFFVSDLEEAITEDIAVYPNPTEDVLNINLEGNKLILISNMIGGVCHRLETTEQSVSLKGFASGMYAVSVYSLDGELLLEEKVVKE